MKRLLSIADLQAKGIPYSRQHIQRLIRGDKFPRPIKLGDGHRIAFLEQEIDAYIEARIAQRDGVAA